MREIKFRVWDEEGNKYTMTISSDGKIEYYNLQNGSGGDEYILEQFTGLYDKNGKEIYEGDIVRIENVVNSPVRWREDIACWALQSYIIGNTWDSSLLEVIGNIHEGEKNDN